jgi:hypothetical protein
VLASFPCSCSWHPSNASEPAPNLALNRLRAGELSQSNMQGVLALLNTLEARSVVLIRFESCPPLILSFLAVISVVIRGCSSMI